MKLLNLNRFGIFALGFALSLGWSFASSVVEVAPAELGKAAPAFNVKDESGKVQSLSQFKGKFVVLEWFNPECPFVKKHYGGGNMQGLQKKAVEGGAVWLSVNSSAPGKQGHLDAKGAASWKAEKKTQSTAILLDSDGTMGKVYDAKTTPHLFVINPEGKLIYQGAIDDKPSTDPEDIAKSTNYVSLALEEAKAGKVLSHASTKPYGCGVKY